MRFHSTKVRKLLKLGITLIFVLIVLLLLNTIIYQTKITWKNLQPFWQDYFTLIIITFIAILCVYCAIRIKDNLKTTFKKNIDDFKIIVHRLVNLIQKNSNFDSERD